MRSLDRAHKKITALLALLLLTGVASAISPEEVEGATRISAEELIALANDEPGLVIVDSRVSANRKHGYIDGSLSLPDTETSCDTLKAFIPTKRSPAAFYCNGVKCGRSAKAVKIAVSCGYQNLYWFRGGFEEWKAKGFPFLHQE